MARSGGGGEGGALKTAVVVLGGLGLAWLTMETAFKPFLDRLRGAIARSDPARDPDDDDVVDAGEASAAGIGASVVEEEESKKEASHPSD